MPIGQLICGLPGGVLIAYWLPGWVVALVRSCSCWACWSTWFILCTTSCRFLASCSIRFGCFVVLYCFCQAQLLVVFLSCSHMAFIGLAVFLL